MIVKKLLVNDGRSEREVLLVGTIVVGRDPLCQLNDLDPLLSRRHAEFVPTSKGVTVRDLKSRNGILVNGDKVPEHLLKPGDVVQLGHLHVRYVEEPVVKSPEDHNRVRAKTETGIEVPTMAAVIKPVAPALLVPAGSAALQAEKDPDATIAPIARSNVPPARDQDDDPLELPSLPSLEGLISARTDDVDMDATVASLHRPDTHRKDDDDADATRVPSRKATTVADDQEATVASAPARSHAPAVQVSTGPSTEARVVANMSLIVTEASASCQAVIGARPETIVGGGLTELIARTFRFVATGDGPSGLSMSVARSTEGNTIAVTFKTGLATENHS